MRRHLWLAALVLTGSVPAVAQDKPVRFSLGYAYLQYLEEDGEGTGLGGYLSIASTGRFGLELDVGYHRESTELFGDSIALNTFTANAGPRFAFGSGGVQPFLHVLGGLRYDSIEGESNTAWGGMTGVGLDIPIGSSAFLRLGADFQIYFEADENIKTLRINAGFSF